MGRDVYIARQPIFDSKKNVFAYELLFRSGSKNFSEFSDGDQATIEVISNAFALMGLSSLTGGKRAFINFTENLLNQEIASILPCEHVVVEILEDIDPSPSIIEACRNLKKAGYIIALDDFILHHTDDCYAPLIELADIIKVDFMGTTKAERHEIINKLNNPKVRFLAEKVETNEEFEEGLDIGFSLFQGYFFSKPIIQKKRDIPSNKLNLLHLLSKVNDPNIDIEEIESIIKRDVSLTYKLLKLINSVAFGLMSKVNSVRRAVTLLGTAEIKKWVTLLSMRSLGDDKPEELILTSIIRAKFCELLAPICQQNSKAQDLYLMGMFSLLDAFFDQSMDTILKELQIDEDIRNALMGKENNLYPVLNFVTAYERDNQEKIRNCLDSFGIDIMEISSIYFETLEWANKFAGEVT